MVTGTMVGRHGSMTGDEPSTCRTITGTEYLGADIFRDFCKADPAASTTKKVVVTTTSHGNMISGKALDNRVGCYVLIEVARRLKGSKHGLYFTFTVQEEIGLYGAKTSAFAIRPDWAVVVDVTPAADLAEDADTKSTVISLGKGPCLLHMDESFIADARLNRVIMDVAGKCGVKLQHEVSSFGTTDATNISTVRRGVPLIVSEIVRATRR